MDIRIWCQSSPCGSVTGKRTRACAVFVDALVVGLRIRFVRRSALLASDVVVQHGQLSVIVLLLLPLPMLDGVIALALVQRGLRPIGAGGRRLVVHSVRRRRCAVDEGTGPAVLLQQ